MHWYMKADRQLVLAVGLPLVLGAVAGLATRTEAKSTWYTSLKKPDWTPPNYLFGPVWTVLYILMGLASYRVWKAGGRQEPMILYGVQLALNVAWSMLFFNAKSLSWALFDVLALLGVLVATTVAFYRIDRVAGYMMLPYLAWVAFAAALTANIYRKNRDA